MVLPAGVVSQPGPSTAARTRRALIAPLALAAVAAVGLVLVRQVDPAEPGHYPLCPFRAVTGWDCPGCGTMRGTHDLLHGDVLAALDHNVLLAFALPVALVAWIGWVRRAWKRSSAPPRGVPAPVMWSVVVLIVTFWVVRNVPGVPFLGSS